MNAKGESMDINEYISAPDGEMPLDRIVTDGGMCAIFRTAAVIGDSLSSGEFESLDSGGSKGYHDTFEYSWGQYLARDCGSKVYNFSRGGMTASEYCDSFAQESGFWDPCKAAQCYILALGYNDLFGLDMPAGSAADIHPDEPDKNEKTFAGYYGRILSRYHRISPRAYFFLMTMPKEGCDSEDRERKRASHAALLCGIADIFPHTYVIDLYRYAPVYDDDFKRRFYLGGHMSPAGYRLTAKMTESCIDYIIRHDPEDFAQAGFIGTDIWNVSARP